MIKVYFTEDSIRGIELEAKRHPNTECFVQAAGVRIGDNFYFDRFADSGINATYTYGMTEKDHVYCDHLANKQLAYHEFDPRNITVTQIHKHPPGFYKFSGGDKIPNMNLARQYGGAVCGLMWVDPEFRFQMFYIDPSGREYEVDYEVNDEEVAKHFPKKDLGKIKSIIEANEKPYLKKPGIRKPEPKKSFFGNIVKKNTNEEKENTEKENSEMKDMEDNIIMNVADLPESTFDFEAHAYRTRAYNVLLPEVYSTGRYVGNLYGYYVEASKTFNIVTDKVRALRDDTVLIGYADIKAADDTQDIKSPFVNIIWTEDGQDITVAGDPEASVEVEIYSVYKDVFSRNKGVIESEMMADKQAVIAGLTNGAFTVGEKLIEAGIGSLIVCDSGIVSKEDIGSGFDEKDVGKYRADVFRAHAAAINPDCDVIAFKSSIDNVKFNNLYHAVIRKSVILACTDNRVMAGICRDYADVFCIPFIASGFESGFSDGRLFFYDPETKTGTRFAGYRGGRKEQKGVYKVLSRHIDEEFNAYDIAKSAMDSLMKGEEGYEPKLLTYIDRFATTVDFTNAAETEVFMRMFGKTTDEVQKGQVDGFTVYIPEDYRQSRYEGDLYGFYVEATGTINVVPESVSRVCPSAIRLGYSTVEADEVAVDAEVSKICVLWTGDTAEVTIAGHEGEKINTVFYAGYAERNGSDAMKSMRAFVAGVGSGGFVVAMGLVKAGIGSVVVFDDDIVGYDNVGKHPSKAPHVGMYKIDSFARTAALINPECEVITYRKLFQDADPVEIRNLVTENSVVLCCADNRHAAYVCNEFADEYHIPFVAGGCGARASSGEFFLYKPDMDMPCYTCAFGEDRGLDLTNNRTRREFYIGEKELERMSKHSGMSIDICLTAYDIVKAGIDFLMEKTEGYEAGFIEGLNQFNITVNFVAPEDINQMMRLFNPNIGERRPYARKSSAVVKNKNCSCCGSAADIDEAS